MANDFTFLGHLGSDPETKEGGSWKKTTLSIATRGGTRLNKETNQKEKVTHWHTVVAWDRNAELLAQYCKKGDQILVMGSVEPRTWKGDDGKTNKVIDFVVRRFEFVGGRKYQGDQQQQQEPNRYGQGGGAQPYDKSKAFDDNDIPY